MLPASARGTKGERPARRVVERVHSLRREEFGRIERDLYRFFQGKLLPGRHPGGLTVRVALELVEIGDPSVRAGASSIRT